MNNYAFNGANCELNCFHYSTLRRQPTVFHNRKQFALTTSKVICGTPSLK